MPLGKDFDVSLDWPAASVKCCLLKDSFVWDRLNEPLYSDVSADETSGTNYTAGGLAVSGKTRTVVQTGVSVGGDNFTYEVQYDCNDVTFTNVTVDFRYFCFYVTTTGRIIGVYQEYEPRSVVGADVKFQVPSVGLFVRDLQ